MAKKKEKTETAPSVFKVKLTTSCVSLPHDVVYPDENGYATVSSDVLESLKALGVVDE